MRLLFPVLVLIWIGVGIFLTGFIITTYTKYEDRLCLRKITVEQDIEFYNKNCKDPQRVSREGTHDYCIVKEHALHKSPERYAIVDTFSEIGLCYRTTCEELFGRSAFIFPLAIVVPTLVFLLLLICGCNIFKFGIAVNKRRADSSFKKE